MNNKEDSIPSVVVICERDGLWDGNIEMTLRARVF